MKITTFNNCVLLIAINSLFTEVAADADQIFKQHTQSRWLNDTNHKIEAVTRNPELIIDSAPTLIMEKFEDHQYRQKLESFYDSEDFDGLQTFGEHRASQLKTESSPAGEAWRLLNQSPDHYYPDANEQRILGAMELGVNALQHPNTWSKQKHWPVDAQGKELSRNNIPVFLRS